MALMGGQLVPEGLLSQFGAHIVGVTHCEAYRVCQADFLLAANSVPVSYNVKCFVSFEEAFNAETERIRLRLESARGALRTLEPRRAAELVIPAPRTGRTFLARLLAQDQESVPGAC